MYVKNYSTVKPLYFEALIIRIPVYFKFICYFYMILNN